MPHQPPGNGCWSTAPRANSRQVFRRSNFSPSRAWGRRLARSFLAGSSCAKTLLGASRSQSGRSVGQVVSRSPSSSAQNSRNRLCLPASPTSSRHATPVQGFRQGAQGASACAPDTLLKGRTVNSPAQACCSPFRSANIRGGWSRHAPVRRGGAVCRVGCAPCWRVYSAWFVAELLPVLRGSRAADVGKRSASIHVRTA